jgi:hypothetical protein
MYLFNPPLALYLAKHPHHRPRSMWLGIVLVTAGLIGAAFASQAWILILCQGVLYAIGGSKFHEAPLTDNVKLMAVIIQFVCIAQLPHICE